MWYAFVHTCGVCSYVRDREEGGREGGREGGGELLLSPHLF